MKHSETAELLRLMAAYDRRTVGDADVLAWHQVVGDLRSADCQAAVVAHYSRTRDWAMPADIRDAVHTLRQDRLRTAGDPPTPPVDGDDVAAYLAWIGHYRVGIADGLDKAGAEGYADAAMGITRPAVETRARPVAELVASVAAGTRMPRRDAS